MKIIPSRNGRGFYAYTIPYTAYLKYPLTVYLTVLEDPAITICGWPITDDKAPAI